MKRSWGYETFKILKHKIALSLDKEEFLYDKHIRPRPWPRKKFVSSSKFSASVMTLDISNMQKQGAYEETLTALLLNYQQKKKKKA